MLIINVLRVCMCRAWQTAGMSKKGRVLQAVVKKSLKRERGAYTGMQRLALAISVFMAAACGSPAAAGKNKKRGFDCTIGISYQLPEDPQVLPSWLYTAAREWCSRLCREKILPGLPSNLSWVKHGHFARAAKLWFDHLFLHFNVEPSKPLHRRGTHNIPDIVLDECIAVVVHNQYLTKKEAEHEDPYLKMVMYTYDCSIFYLFNKMKERNPAFKKCLVFEPKVMKSPREMTYRVIYSQLMKYGGLERLMRYVWVDQKKLYVTPSPHGMRAWGLFHMPGGTHLAGKHPLCAPKWSKSCVYYYAAVNAVLGPIGTFVTTGCKGPRTASSPYVVS
jgi:hypothetical protein